MPSRIAGSHKFTASRLDRTIDAGAGQRATTIRARTARGRSRPLTSGQHRVPDHAAAGAL